MNLWHRADPSQIKPESFLACIEIPQGSKNKYELDKYSGALKLDRILYTIHITMVLFQELMRMMETHLMFWSSAANQSFHSL